MFILSDLERVISAFLYFIFNFCKLGNAVLTHLIPMLHKLNIEITLFEAVFPNSIHGRVEWTKGTLTYTDHCGHDSSPPIAIYTVTGGPQYCDHLGPAPERSVQWYTRLACA